MDYTGLSRFAKYKLNRPLTDDDRSGQLRLESKAGVEPLDWMSVIKINSTYLELVDRWYPVKGWWTWMGLVLALPFSAFAIVLLALVSNGDLSGSDLGVVASGLAGAAIAALIALGGVWVLRHEAFRQTHYPIRLNRKTRQVYAFRPDGTLIRAGWDELFLTAVKSELTMGQSSEDVRAYVLDPDGHTVRDTFTLAYPFLGDREGLMRLWEYVRRYMESPDGVEKNYQLTEICMPIDGRREGILFGIVRTFAPFARWPFLQLAASPFLALTALGRWFAMSTSKVPVWPQDVEADCQVDAADPFTKDWRSNGKYDFYELWWPVICVAVGLIAVAAGVGWLISAVL